MKKLLILSMCLLAGCASNGTNGANGTNGHNSLISFGSIPAGSTCLYGGIIINEGLDANGDGNLETTEVQQSQIVCQGSTAQAPTYTPTVAITPCGPNSATYKEALLGLFGGGVYAYFVGNLSNPADSANILLPDGNYYDTDTSQCNFSLTTDSSGNRLMSWNGSSNDSSGPYPSGYAYFNASTNQWTTSY